MTILQQIDHTKRELRSVKPRSQRRTVLVSRLRDLVVRQIRAEMRFDRKSK